MVLPNNILCRCVKGGDNEQAGNDLFDHLASHIWIWASFITTAGLTPFCIDITQSWNVSSYHNLNVSAEVPLLPSLRRWPFMFVLARQCSVKKVCVCARQTNPHPTVIKLLWVPEPSAGMDGSHAAPRWTLKRQQRAKMGQLTLFCPSAFLFHRWVQIIFCAILSDYCITVAKGGCIRECRGN